MAQAPSSAQIRAARAMLDWSIVQLARSAKVSAAAVHEAEGRSGRPVQDVQRDLILGTLQGAGITFLGDDALGSGLRLSAVRDHRARVAGDGRGTFGD